jgi:hypothetical protein
MCCHLRQKPSDTSEIEEAEWLEELKLGVEVYMWPSRGVTKQDGRVPADHS